MESVRFGIFQYMGRYAIFLILTIFFSCEPTKPKYEPEPNVVAVLNTSLERQQVFVGKSYKISEVPDTSDWVGVSNVLVKISYDTITVIFNELADTPGVYVSESLPVEPLKAYALEVIYPDDKKVTGETTVPGAFRMITPTDGDTIDIEEELRWEESEGAACYLIRLKELEYYVVGSTIYENVLERLFRLDSTTSVSLNSLRGRYHISETYYSQTSTSYNPNKIYTIQVMASDSNCCDYYTMWWYELEMHLTGGLGVFGSFTVTDSITVILRE